MYYYRAWSEPQAPPPPPPSSPPPATQTAGVVVYGSHPPPPQNQHYPITLHHSPQPLLHSPYPTNPSLSHPHSNPIPIQWNPSGNDPYAPHGGYASVNYPCAGVGTSSVAVAGAVDGGPGHGGEESRAISATEAIRQDGTYTVGYVAAPPNCFLVASVLPHQNSFSPPIQSVMPHQNPFNPPIQSLLPPQNSLNPPIQSVPPRQNAFNPPFQSVPPHQTAFSPPILKNKRKAPKRATKVPQTSHCGVCKLDCSSHDTLKSHKLGKKHLKNLQKLQDSITLKPTRSAKIAANNGQEQSTETKRKSASLPETEDELKTKKIRVLQSGAAADEVRVCSICNVVANSQKVYMCHLAGQKHQAMVQKLKKAGAS